MGTVWLAQYLDLFGVWSLTARVVAFNVLLVQALREHGWSRTFARRTLVVAVGMLAVPLAYAGLRAATLAPADTLSVTGVYTDLRPGRERRRRDADRAGHPPHRLDGLLCERAARL